MLKATFHSKLRRNRVCILECLMLAAAFIVTAFFIHRFNFAHGYKLDREIMVSEALLLEIMTIGGLALFTWRRIQEKEREIAKRARSERRARQLAHEDPLTQIANRRQFYKVMNAAAASHPAEGAHALLLLDLNGFKQINDQFGHRAGDALLVIVAKRLSALLRDGETVARLGGDEFAVVARGVAGVEGAKDVAARILKRLQEPVLVGAVTHQLGLGVGIALSTRDRVKPDELMRRADVALYKAKTVEGSAVAIYRSEIDGDLRQIKETRDCAELLAEVGAVPEGQRDRLLRSHATDRPPQLKLVG